MRTTVNLEDELYKRLVNEALKKYGNTKNISKIINENLISHLKEGRLNTESKKLEDEEIKRRLEIAKKSAGIWKIKESGVEYVRRLRRESEKRFKRLGI